MQGFCPLCSKNGIEAKIKAFQLNFDEAVFMCSNTQCPWPIGCEELTIINRPIGKDWSKSWDKVAMQKLKNLQVDKTVPDQSTAFIEYSCTVQENSTTASEPSDLSLDIIFDNGSYLASKPLAPKASLSPTTNEENSNTSAVAYKKLPNLKNSTLTVNSNTTSLDNNIVPGKTISLSCNLSRLSKLRKSLGSKPCASTRPKAHLYKKFSLNDLQKAKSKNAEKLSKKQTEEKEMSNIRVSQIDSDSNSSLQSPSDSSESARNNDDSDFNLDEILDGFCNEISGKTVEDENTNDFDWLDSLVL